MSLAKIVAREWIIFLLGVVVGLLVVPTIWVTFIESHLEVSGYYEALLFNSDWFMLWLFVLVPYALFQLGRITMWAIKETRN